MIAGVLRLDNPMSALVWLALFVPGHLLDGRLGFVLPAAIFLFGGMAIATKPSSWETRGPSRQAVMIFFLLALIDAVSYAYSMAFNGIRTGALDLVALARPLCLGVFVVYLIRHHDASVRRSVESALMGAVYFTLFLCTIDARRWFLFEPVQSMGYLSVLAAVYFSFFSRAPLRLAHALAAVVVVLFCVPPGLVSLRDAAAYCWRSPVFGWGPAFYEPMSSLGNQYQRWMLRNGVLGAGLILIGLSTVAFRLLRSNWNDRLRLAGAATFLGVAFGMLMTGAFLEDLRLFALTSFLIAGMHEDGR